VSVDSAFHKWSEKMFAFLWWLIIGLVAGALARLLIPGRQPMGMLMTMVLGLVGSVVGGLISSVVFVDHRRGDCAGRLRRVQQPQNGLRRVVASGVETIGVSRLIGESDGLGRYSLWHRRDMWPGALEVAGFGCNG
jgi:uncharacterized membrane protein YeaQ/YmgE (transglycosylase-associated protein family)